MMDTLATPNTVLVVEDESTIAHFICEALANNGCKTIHAGTLSDGLQTSASRRPDLILVDLGLPDGDGRDLIESVRRYSTVPIIVLSARAEENEKILALDAGADDYLTKPFSMAELLARVRAQLRRRALQIQTSAQQIVRIGPTEVNLAARLVSQQGKPIHLTRIEFRLLATLIASRGKVLTQRQLLNEVWGPEYIDRPQYLRVYMAHLRSKLEEDPLSPKWLLTENGVGYRLAL